MLGLLPLKLKLTLSLALDVSVTEMLKSTALTSVPKNSKENALLVDSNKSIPSALLHDNVLDDELKALLLMAKRLWLPVANMSALAVPLIAVNSTVLSPPKAAGAKDVFVTIGVEELASRWRLLAVKSSIIVAFAVLERRLKAAIKAKRRLFIF